MSYLIKLIKSLKEIIITYILQYLIIIIACIIYILLGKTDTQEFINNYCSYILIIYYILTILYLYLKNKKTEPYLPKTNYYQLISLGISLSCFLNMIIFLIHKQPQVTTNIPLIILLISSGIIGPIYEEILFRYILLNRLKTFNSTTKSIILNSIIFALIHINPIKICYTFILGLILNLTYQKYNNIIAPILIHASANIISLFLTEFNIYILILSTMSLIITIYTNKTIFNKEFN